MSDTIEAEFTIVQEAPTAEEIAAQEAAAALAAQEELEQEAVAAEDLVLLIEKYLSDKRELQDEDDSFNISNGSIFRWDFKNIPCPTTHQLYELIAPAKTELEQKQTKAEAEKFLADTDWKVLRHRDQQELGLSTSLTGEEFQELLQQRQMARNAIIR